MFAMLFRFAAACNPGAGGDLLGLPTWYKYLDGNTSGAKCTPVIDFTNHPEDIGKILLAVFEIVLRIGSLAAIGFVIFGGVQYILSQGEPEQTKGARSTIVNALIGLVITIFATAIVNVIGRSIG